MSAHEHTFETAHDMVVRRVNEIGRPWEWHEDSSTKTIGATLDAKYFRDIRIIRTDGTVYVTAVLRASEETLAAARGNHMGSPDGSKLESAVERIKGSLARLWFREGDVDLFPRVVLDVEPGIPDEDLFYLTRCLEMVDTVSVTVRHQGEIALEERIPALSPLLDDVPLTEPRFITEFSAVVPAGRNLGDREVGVFFENAGPGLAVVGGHGGTGKTMFVRAMLKEYGAGRSMEDVLSRSYTAERMRLFRRAVGYGQADGTLLMPLAHEGITNQNLEKLGLHFLGMLHGTNPQWSGMVADIPRQGLSMLTSYNVADLFTRAARTHQVVVTERDSQAINMWTHLARGMGAAVGITNLSDPSHSSSYKALVNISPATKPSVGPSR